MKNSLLVVMLLWITTLTVQADKSVQTINDTNCKLCHQMTPSKHKNMKAPPFNKISSKLKYDFNNNKEKFVAFVKDYIVNPSKDKTHCHPRAIKRFGLMPPMGKSLTPSEVDAISNWLYDNFNEKSDVSSHCKYKKASKCHGKKCESNSCKKSERKNSCASKCKNKTHDKNCNEKCEKNKTKMKCGRK